MLVSMYVQNETSFSLRIITSNCAKKNNKLLYIINIIKHFMKRTAHFLSENCFLCLNNAISNN